MPRDPGVHLEDILEAIQQIRVYTEGYDEETFRQDRKTQDAVVRNLEIIGEAARGIPESLKATGPEIDWRKLVSLRNLLIHEYFGVSLPIIWDIVQTKLTELEGAAKRMLKGVDGEGGGQ